MKFQLRTAVAALALGVALSGQAAQAQSWDVYSTFNNGPNNTPTMASPWIYGQRAGPNCSGTATAFSLQYVGPSGTGFTGWRGVSTPQIVPLVGRNPNGTQTVYSSAQVPANSVWLHPGETKVNPVCAVVRFKAPMAGKFRVQGFFRSIDTGANKVNGYIYVNNSATPLVGPIPISGPMGTQVAFDQVVTLVGNPRTIDIAIDDGGSYYNDSTQLDLVITRCPPKGKGDKGAKPGGNGAGNDKECDVRGDHGGPR